MPRGDPRKDRDNDAAPDGDQQRSDRTGRAKDDQHGSGCRACGRGIGPASADSDCALETDQRAEESADHQRAMEDQLIRPGQGQRPSETQEPEPDSIGERQHRDREERYAIEPEFHWSCRLASSDIKSGDPGGSSTISTVTPWTPDTRDVTEDSTRSCR